MQEKPIGGYKEVPERVVGARGSAKRWCAQDGVPVVVGGSRGSARGGACQRECQGRWMPKGVPWVVGARSTRGGGWCQIECQGCWGPGDDGYPGVVGARGRECQDVVGARGESWMSVWVREGV